MSEDARRPVADEGTIETGAVSRSLVRHQDGRGPRRIVSASRWLGLRRGGWEPLRLWSEERGGALVDSARADIEGGLAFPILVALFAFGIALYFVLPTEPWAPAVVGLAVLLGSATLVRRRRGIASRGLATAAVIVAGVAVAAVATRQREAPRLDHERGVVVEGRVSDVDTTQRGGIRMGVDVVRMEGRGLTAATTPIRIAATLTVHGGHRPSPGDGVRFKARLKPPEGPVLPGGYDFARRAWFDGRGASGYVLGRVTPIDLGPPRILDRVLAPVGVLRHAIAERVRGVLPGATGAIGAALMVGEQRAIPESANEPLRSSGLTHIVSISGLHMSLVAGGVIAFMRFAFAFFPALALRWPVKKWAASVAILVATTYLVLSGNQIAALRSHLMLSIALVAVIVDRPAITMHTVAVSALAILVWDPSQAMEPSFLMSYLAVIALVASYDVWRLREGRRPPPSTEPGRLRHAVVSLLRQIEGMAFSSLVAGLATAPVIAGIFYRGAPYSILANMIVLPVTGLLIMPAAVLAALLMPFGLDAPALWAMGVGIEFMLAIARWTASLPAGGGWIGLPHPAMMPLGILGVLWMSLWRSRVRLLGLVPALIGAALVFVGPRPDVFVGRHGSPVAVRGADGYLHVLSSRQDRFDTAIWLAADADPRPVDVARLSDGWRCDPLGCLYRLPGRTPDPSDDLVVAVVRDVRGFPEDCRRATLVVSALEAPPGCASTTTVVDRSTLARDGATTLRFVGEIHGTGSEPRVDAGWPIDDRNAPPVTSNGAVPRNPGASKDQVDEVGASLDSGSDGYLVGETSGKPDKGKGTAESSPDDSALSPRSALTSEPDDEAENGADPSGEPTVEPSGEVPRRDLVATTALPRPPRPWTPRDHLTERRIADARMREEGSRPTDPPRPKTVRSGPLVDTTTEDAGAPPDDRNAQEFPGSGEPPLPTTDRQ